MAQSGKAFVELNYLTELSGKTLPYLGQTQLELEQLESFNEEFLGGPTRYIRQQYMPRDQFGNAIHFMTEHFLNTYPERYWKEWNTADARAYRLLLEKMVH